MSIRNNKQRGYFWHEGITLKDQKFSQRLMKCFTFVGNTTRCGAWLGEIAKCGSDHRCCRIHGHTGVHVDVACFWGQEKLTRQELRSIIVAIKLGVNLG